MTESIKNIEDFSPVFEDVHSHLDHVDAIPKPILLNKKPLTNGQFGQKIHPVIYPSGLVMLNPRWTAQTYNLFYSKHYDEFYDLALKPEYGKAGIVRNMEEVWSRVSGNLNLKKQPIYKVLDAGCGPGYGLEYIKNLNPDIEIFGIEASIDARDILKNNVGATVIDSDIDGDWHYQYEGQIDLIILRHVVEHMLNPIESLSNLRKTLSPKGYLYIAVPDMMHPRLVLRDYDDWWEYWFRAVHPYYYNKRTLFTTLAMSGLEPVCFGQENEEIWTIVRPIPSRKHKPVNFDKDTFVEQIKVLETFLP